MNKVKLIMIVPLLLLMSFSTGCAMKKLSSTEIGVVYKKLPGNLGGYKSIINPGDFVMWFPLVTEVYIVDTQQMYSKYAGDPQNPKNDADDYALNTRALDGNEVGLDTTLRYSVKREVIRKKPTAFLSRMKPYPKFIKEFTKAFNRSIIRRAFGELKTNEFYNNDLRYAKVTTAENVLNGIFQEFGIEVNSVILNGHKFQSEYQKVIDDTRTMEQKAQEQENAIETIKSNKKELLQTKIGQVNESIAKANGELKQAKLRGDAYYAAKKNEAERIMVEGQNEVTAIKKNIEALQKQGGEDLVRLKVAEALMKSGAGFYLIQGQGAGQGSLNVSKMDYNQLLEQLGKLGIIGETPVQHNAK